jgi:hypothetical protein
MRLPFVVTTAKSGNQVLPRLALLDAGEVAALRGARPRAQRAVADGRGVARLH